MEAGEKRPYNGHVEGSACSDTANRYGEGEEETETGEEGRNFEMRWSTPERGVVQLVLLILPMGYWWNTETTEYLAEKKCRA